jgi:hypothetical protein
MKKSIQKVTMTIDTTPAAAWNIIGKVEGVDQWLDPIKTCRLEGNKRYCSTDAGEFAEDILKVDHRNRILQYAIPSQQMLPVENIQGQMSVHESHAGKATIEWSWIFDVDEEREAEAKLMLSQIGAMGISGIETLIKSELTV